jgi:uncharacterized protein YecT (DUF1311 family)
VSGQRLRAALAGATLLVAAATGCGIRATSSRPFPTVSGLPVGSPNSAAPTSSPGCGDLSTQAEISQCFTEVANSSKAKLDELLAELKSYLGEARFAPLNVIQLQWQQYRDDECDFEAHHDGGSGSIAGSVFATCVDTITRERIDQLKLLLCEGGGLTGECKQSRRYDQFGMQR